MSGSRHQRLFKENVRKTKRGLWILKRRVQELFTHREGISTSRARHKGWQPLIECAKCDFKIFYFPSFIFYFFFNQQGCCPCSYVSPSAMRKSYLRSSFIRMLMFLFERFILKANKKLLRRWTLKQHFNSFEKKVKRIVKVLDLEMILSDIWQKESWLWIDFCILVLFITFQS